MSYPHVVTAPDLARWGCVLKVECTHCGAARTMNGVEIERVHGNRNFHHLIPRLKCRHCKRKAAKITVLGPVYPR